MRKTIAIIAAAASCAILIGAAMLVPPPALRGQPDTYFIVNKFQSNHPNRYEIRSPQTLVLYGLNAKRDNCEALYTNTGDQSQYSGGVPPTIQAIYECAGPRDAALSVAAFISQGQIEFLTDPDGRAIARLVCSN